MEARDDLGGGDQSLLNPQPPLAAWNALMPPSMDTNSSLSLSLRGSGSAEVILQEILSSTPIPD